MARRSKKHDLLRDIPRRLRRAQRARPDIPFGDMLFTITGDEHVESIGELNASGQPTVFACMRTATVDASLAFPGSARVACTGCGAEVWISPATLATYRRIAKAEIRCEVCLKAMVKEISSENQG